MTRDEAKKQMVAARAVCVLAASLIAIPTLREFFSRFGESSNSSTLIHFLAVGIFICCGWPLINAAITEFVLLMANGRSQDKA